MRPSLYLSPFNTPSGVPLSSQLTSVCPDLLQSCQPPGLEDPALRPGEPLVQRWGGAEETQGEQDKAGGPRSPEGLGCPVHLSHC